MSTSIHHFRTHLEKGLYWFGVILQILSILSIAAIAIEHGFEESPIPVIILRVIKFATLGMYVILRSAEIISASRPFDAIRAYRTELLVLGGVSLFLLIYQSAWQAWLILAVVYVAMLQIGGKITSQFSPYIRLQSVHKPLRAGRLMFTSFLSLILIGGALLSLPKAVTPELRHQKGHYATQRIVNGFFTATSATCVTGLVVYQTGQDYTLFGQIVILGLIQLGGLGIMVFGSVMGLMVRRKLSLRESLMLQDLYSHHTISQIGSLIKFIVLSTLVLEALGAVLMYGLWPEDLGTASTRWYYSIFHSVSAFCNAGFALDSRSLIPYQTSWQAYGVFMPLIVLGGLGFPVLSDLFQWGRDRIRRKAHARVSLHTKLVLVTTLILIVVPTGLFVLFETREQPESNRVDVILSELPPSQRVLAAAFRSVTCRTAGFNVTSTREEDNATATLFLSCVLMFIGGSPASTAGGVKTVAIAVLFLSVLSTLRKRESVEVFKRQITPQVTRQAGVVIIVMFATVTTVVMLLCYTEHATLGEVLFEAVSACGTVGLSTGLTPHLTLPGKCIIMLAMFAGRLGPLTLLVALAGRDHAPAYHYATEEITIG